MPGVKPVSSSGLTLNSSARLRYNDKSIICYNLPMETTHTSQSKDNLWLWIALGGGVLIAVLCACLIVLAGAGIAFGVWGGLARPVTYAPATLFSSSTRPSYDEATPAPTLPVTPMDVPGNTPAPMMPVAPEALMAELPPRDRYDLARRFLGISEATPPTPRTYAVGDVISFWVDNDDAEAVVEVRAELVYIAENVYMWVEQGLSYDYAALVESAERFSQETYPTNRAYFGSEASPGIDGDPRLHILNSGQLGWSILGYFYSPSEYPVSVVPYSNEKEIFFINIENIQPGEYYDGVLAHEFQHMIHWNVDRNEESWMNEGMSELAAFLNGFGPSDAIPFFLMDPDLQLNSWPDDPGASYGSAFLFNAYFLDRFGQDALRELVANPGNGLAAVDETLAHIGAGVTADEVFADWVIANLLNDADIPPGIYGYPNIPALYPLSRIEGFSVYPVDSGWRQVHQYGTDYIEMYGPAELTIGFEGTQQVRILPANTYNTDGDTTTDDHFVWWSNRGDDSDMTLTRRLDLTDVNQAVLEYDVWYAIEEGWDYAYLAVSTDDGETWTILPTPHTTTDDPHGNSYGSGYTGFSRDQPGANAEGWLHESIDLSAYAGQEILLRFELITDDAVNEPGLALDNLCLRAIGWCDDAEAEDGGWEARGFVRHNNVLAQRFVVQAVVPDGSGSYQVVRMPLDQTNRGEMTVTVPGGGEPAVLVVSGLTRHTTEAASYRYTITVGP